MFAEMRRKDRAMSPAESEALLAHGEYGVLSLVGPQGFPHAVPMSYAFRENALWFHCAPEGTKLEALRADSRASFCVVGETEVLPEKFSTRYASVIVQGAIREVDGTEAEFGLMALLEKYCPDHLEEGRAYLERAKDGTCVLRLDIQHLSGKARR